MSLEKPLHLTPEADGSTLFMGTKIPKLKEFHVGAQEMQTICARVLGMEREVSSIRRPLDAMAYKAHAAQQEIKELQHQQADLKENIGKMSASSLKNLYYLCRVVG